MISNRVAQYAGWLADDGTLVLVYPDSESIAVGFARSWLDFRNFACGPLDA